jgi:uridylate kinase
MKAKYKRVVLKLSGEALMGSLSHGIDTAVCALLAKQIKGIVSLGVEIAIVVGGGNIFRGVPRSKEFQMQRSVADYMGMTATILNGLALQNALENQGVESRVMTAIEINKIAEPYICRRALRHLEKKRVVILVAGTGNPFFTTDTAAALRATEVNADVILKATKVDGVYSDDPIKNKKAKFFTQLTYKSFLDKELKVMDATAITLCRENNVPIIVFNFTKESNLKKVICGQKIGTLIKS